MNICAWMVLKDDAYYLPMALKSVEPYVNSIYIQDQGSTDGSYEIAKEFQEKSKCNIVIERIDTHMKRFDQEYNEPKYRSLAIERAEIVFNPEYLLKLDADEIYTPYFFNKVNELKAGLEGRAINSLRMSGERFIARDYKTASPHALFIHNGNNYYDPHTHFWSTRVKVRYVKNPAMSGSFLHCVLSPEPNPIYWVPGICNIHLHRTFGPKSLQFWSEGGDEFDWNARPFNARVMAPKWFASDVNMGTAEKVNFDWPDYVLEKWNEWGIW